MNYGNQLINQDSGICVLYEITASKPEINPADSFLQP